MARCLQAGLQPKSDGLVLTDDGHMANGSETDKILQWLSHDDTP